MKFDIKNPAFMQAACAVSSVPYQQVPLKFKETDIEIKVASVGNVEVHFIKQDNTPDVVVAPSINGFAEFSLSILRGSNVTISGKITSIEIPDDYTCYQGLEAISLEDTDGSIRLNIGNLNLPSLNYVGVRLSSELSANDIATAINHGSSQGRVLFFSYSEYNQIVIDAAQGIQWQIENDY